MKGLKIVSFILTLVGFAAVIAIIIWENVDPTVDSLPAMLLTLTGFYSLPIGLLGLIIFYIVKFIQRGKTEQRVK